jgi:N-methylhydantoinase A/oxoprolinase/acetone carboxylase beta subunit
MPVLNSRVLKSDVASDDALVEGLTGEIVRILKVPDLYAITKQLEDLQARGFRNLAICFIHSHLYPTHEEQVARLARDTGFEVSVSSELQTTVRHHQDPQSLTRASLELTPPVDQDGVSRKLCHS